MHYVGFYCVTARAEATRDHFMCFEDYMYTMLTICNMYKVELLRCKQALTTHCCFQWFWCYDLLFAPAVVFDCFDVDGSGVLDAVRVSCFISFMLALHYILAVFILFGKVRILSCHSQFTVENGYIVFRVENCQVIYSLVAYRFQTGRANPSQISWSARDSDFVLPCLIICCTHPYCFRMSGVHCLTRYQRSGRSSTKRRNLAGTSKHLISKNLDSFTVDSCLLCCAVTFSMLAPK